MCSRKVVIWVRHFFRKPSDVCSSKSDLSELKQIANATKELVSANQSLLKKLATDMQRDLRIERKKRVKGAVR